MAKREISNYIVWNSAEEETAICDSLEEAKEEIIKLAEAGYSSQDVFLFKAKEIPFSLKVEIKTEGENKA